MEGRALQTLGVCLHCKKTLGFFKGQKGLVAELLCFHADVRLRNGALDYSGGPSKLKGDGPEARPTAGDSSSEHGAICARP